MSLTEIKNYFFKPYIGCPEEIKTWNWGAFLLPVIWSPFNNVYWPLILIPLYICPVVGLFFHIIISIFLGINGNAWAWKAIDWEYIDGFQELQNKWKAASICIATVIASAILIVFSCINTCIPDYNIH